MQALDTSCLHRAIFAVITVIYNVDVAHNDEISFYKVHGYVNALLQMSSFGGHFPAFLASCVDATAAYVIQHNFT